MHAGTMDTADNQLMAIAHDLRAYADAGMDPTLATKLRAAAAEMEQPAILRRRARIGLIRPPTRRAPRG